MADNKKLAFLMVDFETPDFIKELHNKIPEDELFTDPDDEVFNYGLEKETHTTLAACLDNDVDLDEIKKILLPLKDYGVALTDVSMFGNKDYDVLKCNAASMNLYVTNKKILDKFPSHSEFKEYHPHVTIGYLKKVVLRSTRRMFWTSLSFSNPSDSISHILMRMVNSNIKLGSDIVTCLQRNNVGLSG